MADVGSLIETSKGYATQLVGAASTALAVAAAAAGSISSSNVTPGKINTPATVEVFTAEPPSFEPYDLQLDPLTATEPVLQEIRNIEGGAAPTYNFSPPSIDLPTAPSQLSQFSDRAPDPSSVQFPSTPSLTDAGSAPSATTYQTPVKPQVYLPAFDGVMPSDVTGSAPTGLDVSFAANFKANATDTKTELAAVRTAFMNELYPDASTHYASLSSIFSAYLSGDTALPVAAENALYERSRGKADAEATRARDAAYKDAADRGFTIPAGALISALQQSRQAAADNNAKAGTDIAIAQADMMQKNRQFIVTTLLNYRQQIQSMMQAQQTLYVQINGQALEYAKNVANYLIEAYNAAVRAYTVKLDTYRAQIAACEVRLKVATAGIELYQAEIASLNALVQADRSKVEVYRARIDAQQAQVGIYKAQIDAVLGQVQFEKLKLESFQTRVQAYATQVQAKASEWQGYTAAVEGQMAKAKLFSAQVDAYSAQVNGYRANIEAQAQAAQAAAMSNKARADNFTAQVEAYKSVVQARGQVASVHIDNQKTLILAYQAAAQSATAKSTAEVERYRAVSTVATAQAQMDTQALLTNASNAVQAAGVQANLVSQVGSVWGHMAGAAVAGINSLAVQTNTVSG